jgi:two-component system, response regulator YesN
MAQLLIVDDEIHVVERLATLVPWEKIGVERVYKAFSGEEALQWMETESIDVVITDIQMPGMTGLELAAEVKKRWRSTRCLLLSGHADFQYASEAIRHGTVDYLLKPVTDEDLLAAVDKVLLQLQAEWEDIISQQRTALALRENLPLLRGSLLQELLLGRKLEQAALQEKMELLQIPMQHGAPFAMMLIRMEEHFYSYDARSLSLFEYAIANMAEELFGNGFDLWHCKDAHDYLVFVLRHRGDSREQQQLERAATQLQKAVKTYLKGTISVLVTRRGVFPDDLAALYQSSLSSLRRRIGSERELFMTVSDEREEPKIQSLQSLYELPTLTHLLESSQWDAIAHKLARVFEELKSKWAESQEHLLEVYFAVSSAFSFIAHKSGRPLSDIIGIHYDKLTEGLPFKSLQLLENWTFAVLKLLEAETEEESRDARAHLVRQVQQFIEQHLATDVSLQAIAEHVYLHPVYISKIYKLETGTNLSDYVYQVRMDKAARLLLDSQEKIYEIAAQLGYQRAHSFIHVFKKHTGYTPQEYRDRHLPPN